MSSRAQFIVLCEDLQAQVFIYRALVRKGVEKRRIYRFPLPSKDNGAGDAWVIKHYPGQVKAVRVANAKAATGLAAHVDADPHSTVVARHRQLAGALVDAGVEPRRSGEPIAELVPKRNIETWIHQLDPDLVPTLVRPLNEEEEYPKLDGHEGDAAAGASRFALIDDVELLSLASAIPSLADGVAEFRRLP